MDPSLSLPFVDADRNRMINPGPDGRKPASVRQLRARFTVALVLLAAVWMFLRVNHWFLR
jgi:hypothetical protein